MSTGENHIPIAYVHARHGGTEYRNARDLRERVLRKPLGLPLRDIDTVADAEEELFCAVRGDTVIACLQLKPIDAVTMKLRQMAVEPAFQKSGVGSALVRFAEQWARTRSLASIVLDARVEAVRFYTRLGYVLDGQPFESVGIPHQKMKRALRG
jgi:predicted GNAT family N-acyltransferase